MHNMPSSNINKYYNVLAIKKNTDTITTLHSTQITSSYFFFIRSDFSNLILGFDTNPFNPLTKIVILSVRYTEERIEFSHHYFIESNENRRSIETVNRFFIYR